MRQLTATQNKNKTNTKHLRTAASRSPKDYRYLKMISDINCTIQLSQPQYIFEFNIQIIIIIIIDKLCYFIYIYIQIRLNEETKY